MARKDELYVRKIRSGTVIDHIAAGHAFDVLRILRIDGKDGHVVSVVMNVPSKTIGSKDIVKIDSRELDAMEVDRIALIAPKATINIVRDFEVVEKNAVKLPDIIKGTVKCNNPSCISNAKEPIEPTFLVEKTDPLTIKCRYCSRTMEKSDVLKQF